MRRVLVLLLTCLMLVLASISTACTAEDETPESAVRGWIEAIAEGDVRSADALTAAGMTAAEVTRERSAILGTTTPTTVDAISLIRDGAGTYRVTSIRFDRGQESTAGVVVFISGDPGRYLVIARLGPNDEEPLFFERPTVK